MWLSVVLCDAAVRGDIPNDDRWQSTELGRLLTFPPLVGHGLTLSFFVLCTRSSLKGVVMILTRFTYCTEGVQLTFTRGLVMVVKSSSCWVCSVLIVFTGDESRHSWRQMIALIGPLGSVLVAHLAHGLNSSSSFIFFLMSKAPVTKQSP